MHRPVAEDRFEWALGYCRDRGLRRTHALRQILRTLVRLDRPIGWAALAREPDLADSCDPSSIFRILVKLEEIGVVRRMGAPDRSYYFLLVYPGEHHEHLICTACGRIENVHESCPVGTLERQIESRTGYKALYHELEFFGICPTCQVAVKS